MKARYFGVLLLVLVGVIPIVTAGILVIRRAERTALREVTVGNSRVAARAARRLGAYVDEQVAVLQALSAPFGPAVRATPEQRQWVVKAYTISFPYLRSLDVVGLDCTEVATARIDATLRNRCGEPGVDQALAGKISRSDVKLNDKLQPAMTLAVPLEMAGERIGAVVSVLDLVDLWAVVDEIRVGETGFARLVTYDGTLIAHGHDEEKRAVFLRQKDPRADMVPTGIEQGVRYKDSQGRDVLAVAADVPELGARIIVEQPVSEAYHGAKVLRQDLAIVVVGAVVLALLLGVFAGRKPIESLEAMQKHAREVAKGNLESRVTVVPPVEEMASLARALNEMAAELSRLHEEMRAKERLHMFGRVAAGLAHDIKLPIESVRAACDVALENNDETSRERLKVAAKMQLPRLVRYVNDLLRLAKEGQIPLELTEVSVDRLVDEVIQQASGSQRWRDVSLARDGEAGKIFCDESLLSRAVTNLVANAADASGQKSPPGKVTVTLSHRDGEVLIAVQDTGTGIPETLLKDIMVHDFKSTKRTTGVGLGLGVARHVASAHGGRIDVESRVGAGSTFTIVIPRRPSEARRERNGNAQAAS